MFSEHLCAMGIGRGPTFRGLGRVRRRDGGVCAQDVPLRVVEELKPESSDPPALRRQFAWRISGTPAPAQA